MSGTLWAGTESPTTSSPRLIVHPKHSPSFRSTRRVGISPISPTLPPSTWYSTQIKTLPDPRSHFSTSLGLTLVGKHLSFDYGSNTFYLGSNHQHPGYLPTHLKNASKTKNTHPLSISFFFCVSP